jgi:bifunctional lysine-specific demethylase and histidyl-hydroxylase NO66
MDFAQFISPIPLDHFMDEYYGQRPLHVAEGGTARAGLLSLEKFEELLGILPHWTEENLKLIINSRPVTALHFLEQRQNTRGIKHADPAKVELFARMGASLVADHVEDIDMNVRKIVAMLGEQFGGTAGANAYCSFKDVQAFNSHCDPHEVFAIQLEGEKVWQIYDNRADSPVEALAGVDAQAIIDRAKGKVATTVRMKPGDLLYIPRGYFHDALAQSDVSLHLTFAVVMLDGRSIFRLLEERAKSALKFRVYLPDGRIDRPGLRAHLAELADEVAAMIRSPLLESTLVARQRALPVNAYRPDLKRRHKLDYHAPTGRPFRVDWRIGGAVLLHERGETPLGELAEPAEWALDQPMFSEQQLKAQFAWVSNQEISRLIEELTSAGLLVPCDPPL